MNVAAPAADDAWPFAAMLVWIQSRDEGRALRSKEQIEIQGRLFQQDRDAWGDLLDVRAAMTSGAIHCFGFRSGSPDQPELIPPDEWPLRTLGVSADGAIAAGWKDPARWQRQVMRIRAWHPRPAFKYDRLFVSASQVKAKWPPLSKGANKHTLPALTPAQEAQVIEFLKRPENRVPEEERRKRVAAEFPDIEPRIREKDWRRILPAAGTLSRGRIKKSDK